MIFKSTSHRHFQSGFSLIEMLIVVGLIGILALIVTSSYQNYMNDAKIAKVRDGILSINESYMIDILSDKIKTYNDALNKFRNLYTQDSYVSSNLLLNSYPSQHDPTTYCFEFKEKQGGSLEKLGFANSTPAQFKACIDHKGYVDNSKKGSSTLNTGSCDTVLHECQT